MRRRAPARRRALRLWDADPVMSEPITPSAGTIRVPRADGRAAAAGAPRRHGRRAPRREEARTGTRFKGDR
ncbi:hypothetical protein Arub01_49810 [Actinomadura rubrobrunea]|uniref:Uncharacterized protein n=1 Tax=Actinomadura rubrobrunea TaxID=115335 RepID=A0A9W6UYY7_9ACTN|nr:hypothetical protein Arub01_49810 [Actinomadura rubrobrunea]